MQIFILQQTFFFRVFSVTKLEKLLSVVFRCSLLYIDFEGRSDGESIKRILSLVNPRNLVSSCSSSIRLCLKTTSPPQP